MGHDSARAAMIYQHATAAADQAIATALDKLIVASDQEDNNGPEDGDSLGGVLARIRQWDVNGTSAPAGDPGRSVCVVVVMAGRSWPSA